MTSAESIAVYDSIFSGYTPSTITTPKISLCLDCYYVAPRLT
jgi:hypothetical protein